MAEQESDSPPRPGGVMAAPNHSRITARVVRIAPVSDVPGKWDLELELLEVTALSGPSFAKTGQTVKGFTFEELEGVSAGNRINAQAEYIGDARRGLYQLTEISREP